MQQSPYFLKNARDVKRFVNSFKIIYDITKDELLFEDIFILELIKLKSLVIYNKIADISTFFNQEINDISFNSTYYDDFIKDNNNLKELCLSNEIKDAIKLGINFLYKKEKITKNQDLVYRPISRKENHYLYFNYLFFESISIKEFSNASEKGITYIVDLIDKYKNEIDEYIDIVEKSQEIGFHETSKTLLASLVYCEKYVEDKNIPLDLVIHKIIVNYYVSLKNDSPQVDNLNEFIKNFLAGNFSNILSWNNSHLLLSEVSLLLLEGISLEKHKKIILDNNELIGIINNLFMDYIQKNNNDEKNIHQLLLKTRSLNHTIQSDTLLNEDICKEYFKYLKENNKYYISILIRPYSTKQNLYVFDPYILQIFGSYDEFKNFLSQLKDTDYSKYYLEKFNKYEKNNYNPIEILDFENFKLSYHTV